MKFARAAPVVSTGVAGTTIAYIDLTENEILRVVTLLNETSQFLWGSIELCSINEPVASAQTIALMHRSRQAGSSSQIWEGNFELKHPYTRVRALWEDAVANDVCILTVGYE